MPVFHLFSTLQKVYGDIQLEDVGSRPISNILQKHSNICCYLIALRKEENEVNQNIALPAGYLFYFISQMPSIRKLKSVSLIALPEFHRSSFS
jgi:hypothetical protein